MDKFRRRLSTASYPVRLWAKPSFANATCPTLFWIFPCDSCFLQPNLPGLQALCFLHCCIHNNREFYPSPVCSPVSLSPSLNDKPGKWVHCPYQFFCSLGAAGRPWPRSGCPALPEDGPGEGSCLCSAPRPLLPGPPSRGESRKTRNPSNCGQRSVTISNSGAARLFLHLPGQLCMSMAWGGPGDGSPAQRRPAQLAELKSRWVECPAHTGYWVTQLRAFQWFDFFPDPAWSHCAYIKHWISECRQWLLSF